MSKSKGKLLFWSISELTTTKEKLADLGFDKYVPRNDFKSAMVKTLREVTKGNDKLYRRFNDDAEHCSFAVFEQVTTTEDIKLDKQITLRISKDHGNMEILKSEVSETFERQLKERYREHRDTIDSAQFRAFVLKMVKAEAYAVAMRPGGGIYFTDNRFEPARQRLRDLFAAFPIECKLHEVPIYDDAGTLDALEDATKADLFADIEELVKDIDRRFKAGLITTRQLNSDKERAHRIVQKLDIHREHLRAAAKEIGARLGKVKAALEGVTSKVEAEHVDPNDFISLLGTL